MAGHIRLSDLEPLFVCQAWGRRGADVRSSPLTGLAAQGLGKATHGNAARYHSDCHCEISQWRPNSCFDQKEKAPHTDHYEAHESNRIGEDSCAWLCPQLPKKHKRRTVIARQGPGWTSLVQRIVRVHDAEIEIDLGRSMAAVARRAAAMSKEVRHPSRVQNAVRVVFACASTAFVAISVYYLILWLVGGR